MTRFAVGDDDLSSRKRKQGTETGRNLKKSNRRRGEEGEAMDENLNQDQGGREGEEGGDDVEEVRAGEDGGASSDSVGEKGSSSGDCEVTVKIDLEVLDCTICYEPLRPPLFQCRNGHVACSSCCSKLGNKCHSCSGKIGYSRCLALEKVIESIKMPCSNVEYGCKQTVSYLQKYTHEEKCTHSPCNCPMRGCSFYGSTKMLLDHFTRNHHFPIKSFWYDCSLEVPLAKYQSFQVLHAEDDHLFFLLNDNDEPFGSALSLACIRSETLFWDFSYELTANNKRNTLQVRASATDIQNKLPNYPSKLFLMVPLDFYSDGRIFVDVCIRKNRCSSVN